MTDIQQAERGAPSLSGRYVFNGGVTGRRGNFVDADMRAYTRAELHDPRYRLDSPVFAEPAAVGRVGDEPAITLCVDVDGADPLDVVSGDVAGGSGPSPEPAHFIGRVTGADHDGAVHRLTVAEFRLTWPGTGESIDRLEVSIAGGTQPPSAQATFLVIGSPTGHGPYAMVRESAFFRQVEVEVDVEEGAAAAEPYDTMTHPVRPPGLPGEILTLEAAYAKAGVAIVRSPEGNAIRNAVAGADRRWSNQELHDAMESHWTSFANRPQWKMWIFLAGLGDSDSLGGIMFDGDIQEPGGVDRQGTALFTLSPHFHTPEGAYARANPPAAEAAQRELFFNLLHESGHAFNLAHSFQKRLGTPWAPPPWLPLRDAPKALSWMNYPDEASPGGGAAAAWFYERFPFRFDDGENLFIRHAPGRLVEMGNEAWFQNHARVARSTVDPRLDFRLRTRTDTVELGEAVFVELRLANASDGPVVVHRNLYPSDGLVEVAVTNPRGERRPWQPIAHTRSMVETEVLAPGEALFRELNLTMGQLGFPFKDPGPYRVEASYRNTDGGTAAAVLQLHVRPPASYDDRRTINELFDAGVGRVLQVGGSRLMEDANEKIDWVKDHLGEKHPAAYYLNAARAIPLATPYKLLPGDADEVQVREQDPESVKRRLGPLVERPDEAADVVGHIVYRRLVETYTDAALETRDREDARHAQATMLQLFQTRNVVEPVVREIEQRIDELR